MNWFYKAFKFLHRCKHPVSLPEEIAHDLGLLSLNNEVSFKSCLSRLTSPDCTFSNLRKFMKRQEAEFQFHKALKKERFLNNSLFSYYLFHGWLSFDLVFDEKSRLRRLYMQHNKLEAQKDHRIELKLKT